MLASREGGWGLKGRSANPFFVNREVTQGLMDMSMGDKVGRTMTLKPMQMMPKAKGGA